MYLGGIRSSKEGQKQTNGSFNHSDFNGGFTWVICRLTISLDVIANLPPTASRTSLAADNEKSVPSPAGERVVATNPRRTPLVELKVGSNGGSLDRENFEPCLLNTVSCFASPSGMRDAENDIV